MTQNDNSDTATILTPRRNKAKIIRRLVIAENHQCPHCKTYSLIVDRRRIVCAKCHQPFYPYI